MSKNRLDQTLALRGLSTTRSQAESLIRLGKVKVNGRAITKPGFFVGQNDDIELQAEERYVSRAGLKLASVSEMLSLDFNDKTVLDVGSSTGGFTDYALRHGAKKVVAVDVGTDQLHPSLRDDPKIELHEQTDIRRVTSPDVLASVITVDSAKNSVKLGEIPDMVLIDVSFISLREVLPHIATLVSDKSQIVAMLKPQFEAGSGSKHKGVIKNDSMRRYILKEFELWAKQYFVIQAKADSEVSGARGNQERFYLLRKFKTS
ncbi:MAG TPA: TlyA family RNA methyltransferase [Patescibacteria group bacterium]|jgi:23S rRNA (cytidine1920-2'-O)/16S rRNA (cytidine1409-2'-O)-methyltransferase|nr:TlyA family RNA methyltransferase [Patescibacteria group bacterium]